MEWIVEKKLSLVITIVFYFLLQGIVTYSILSNFSYVTIKAEFGHDDVIQLFHWNGLRKERFQEEYSVKSEQFEAGVVNSAMFIIDNKSIKKLRIDTGTENGVVRISGLKLYSHFGDPVQLDAMELFKRFSPNSSIGRYEVQDNVLLVEVTGKDPYLVQNDTIAVQSIFLRYLLPLFFSLVLFLILDRFEFASFPAISELTLKKSSFGSNYAALDGVRGLAVLLVVASHTWRPFMGCGLAGVWMFFVLSGFLLTTPFARKPESALSLKYMGEYLLRRVKRIVPMYYFVILITFYFQGEYDTAFHHFLFLQGDLHFWTIPQEMFFYLLLPFVMVAVYIVCKGNIWRSACLLFIVTIAIYKLIGSEMVSLYGRSLELKPYLDLFICGIFFSYCFHGISSRRWQSVINTALVKKGTSIVGITLLVGYVLFSTDIVLKIGYSTASSYPEIFAFAAGLIILFVLVAEGSFFEKILSFPPLRAIGIVGYSMYLLHPFIEINVRGMISNYFGFYFPGGFALFIMTTIVTYVLATLTYTYIERPFMHGKKQSVLRTQVV